MARDDGQFSPCQARDKQISLKVSIVLRPRNLSYDRDWATAIAAHYGDYEVISLEEPAGITGDLIVFLHSVTAQDPRIPGWAAAQVKDRKGKLAILTGNDYKLFDEKQRLADVLEADLVGSIVPSPPYKEGKVKKVIHLPHAMGLSIAHKDRSHKDRPITVGFRGFKYPSSIGDSQRNDAVEAFMGKLNCDVEWGVFSHPDSYLSHLGSSKATVATEGGLSDMKAITSRQFDAIGAGAALIQPIGGYSGCLGPEHYIHLSSDLSNVNDCIAQVEDPVTWVNVTTAAYEHCMEHHTYLNRLSDMDAALWPQ